MSGADRARIARIHATALLLVALVGGSCAKSSPPRVTPSVPVVLAGAEYVAPLLRAEVLAFRDRYPDADSIRIEADGSAEGMEQLVNGDVAMSVLMRDLTDPEVQAAVRRDGLAAYTVAWDAVAVIVNPASPIEQVSRTELAQIYGGELTGWGALGWRGGGAIVALTSDPRLGMYGYLEQTLLAGGKYAATIYAPPSEREVVDAVASHPGAIGCVSRPFADTRVRVLRVSQAKGLPYVSLTRESILDKSYPLLRPVSLATPAKPRRTASDLVNFISGMDGQGIVARLGYAPATVPVRIVRTAEEAE
ncbi:MAG TPA: substrate-binding domain-containing protein [Candidatus Eisenbacteria bacterium]